MRDTPIFKKNQVFFCDVKYYFCLVFFIHSLYELPLVFLSNDYKVKQQ